MIEYLILGLLQGVTEWLPVSSQGQTVLVSQLFGMPVARSLDLSIWLHTGTLLAATVYFRHDLMGLLKAERRNLLGFLIISTALTALVGGPLYLLFAGAFSDLAGEAVIAFVGLLLIVTGLVQRSAAPSTREGEGAGGRDAAVAGLLQGLSALPGISRSGITTSALLLRGFSANAALRLSFLMSIFAVSAAEIGLHIRGGFIVSGQAAIAMAGAFATGLLTIDVLLRVAHRIEFWKFLVLLGLLSMVPLALYVA